MADLKDKVEEPTPEDWADAISQRLVDEMCWLPDEMTGADIQEILREGLLRRPDVMDNLIGTTVIEMDYFEELD